MTAASVLAVTGGVVVLAATAVDIIQTVFGASMGGGPLSRWAMGGVAAVAARIRPRRRVLVWTGPLLTAAATPGWLALLWLGWGLVFQPAGSVITTSGQPAGSWERAYFAGYSLTTLGNGEFQPGGAGWQAMTVVTSASGFIVITAGLGYLIAMISAAIQRHTTAARVHALGATPTEMCLASWNGRDLHRVDAELRSAVARLTDRRVALRALVEDDGWAWADVTGGS